MIDVRVHVDTYQQFMQESSYLRVYRKVSKR
jgi:hypothetical protein